VQQISSAFANVKIHTVLFYLSFQNLYPFHRSSFTNHRRLPVFIFFLSSNPNEGDALGHPRFLGEAAPDSGYVWVGWA
jgi:hypothetical protein